MLKTASKWLFSDVVLESRVEVFAEFSLDLPIKSVNKKYLSFFLKKSSAVHTLAFNKIIEFA